MTDRDRERTGGPEQTGEPGTSSTRGGAPRRGGFGDDQGTRVGRPDRSGRESPHGPSSEPVKEGLEGAVFEEDEAEDRSTPPRRNAAGLEGPTGIGGEAARGIHAAGSGEEEPSRSRTSPTTEGDEDRTARSASDIERERPGSEPLRNRSEEHESGYGGRGGEPRLPSDYREH